MTLHLNTPDFPSPNDVLSQVWSKLAKWFFRSIKRIYKQLLEHFGIVFNWALADFKDFPIIVYLSFS